VIPLFFRLEEKGQRILLLVSSFYFYACLKLAFVPILLLSFYVSYYGSLQLNNAKYKKSWLAFILFINLGILILFKYTDFLRSIYFDFRNLFGANLEYEKFGIILPLGISFYTFQAIAYSIDVYRGTIQAEKSFFNFSLFLIFFPQLVAGPIMRADVLLPQLSGKKIFNSENFSSGMGQIALGIFKKTIVADPITNYIKPIYENPSAYDSITCYLAVFFFAIQIYCDFAGYSDIAIGLGKILGFHIPVNFTRPFLSSSSTELWRRWHISLSTWLRDYIYISLGGNRISNLRSYLNLIITMLIGGIWHGANWTFFIWGFICGLSVSIEKYFTEKNWTHYFIQIPKPIKIFYTFSLFMLGALFFRSDNFTKAMEMLKRIFQFTSDGIFNLEPILFIPTLVLFLIEVFEELNIDYKKTLLYQNIRTSLILSILILAGFIYTVTVSPQFYYFQF
jgi:D-alanyl-lipoteichoic acid acyltransferase DltB (MBOAT superfamily)